MSILYSNPMTDLASLLYDPDLMNKICTHVANGGSLIDLCKLWGVPYAKVIRFVRHSDPTSKAYDSALKDRDEWAKERYLSELRSIALADARQAFNADGSIKPVTEWPDSLAANVTAFETIEEYEGTGKDRTWTGYNKRVKFNDKLKALEMLGRNLKLFEADKNVGNVVLLEDLLGLSRSLPDPTSSVLPADPHPPLSNALQGEKPPISQIKNPEETNSFDAPQVDPELTALSSRIFEGAEKLGFNSKCEDFANDLTTTMVSMLQKEVEKIEKNNPEQTPGNGNLRPDGQ